MSVLLLAILFFLGVSLLFYVLFGGADFGAGILELSIAPDSHSGSPEQRKLISHAMAPVWEANHVWLILAVVILFVGFPEIYVLISTYLHLPLMAILVGIVARGSAFTFRHYDTLGKAYDRIYSRVFAWSSLWTSFFLGVTAGAMMLGRIATDAPDFLTAYVWPWLNAFCVSLGIFTCALFAFLASVYLVGEAETQELQAVFKHKARISLVVVLLTGALVFGCAELSGLSLASGFLANRASTACFVVATLLWIPFWKSLKSARPTILLRASAAAIVAAVQLGWFAYRFPIALQTREGNTLTVLTFDSSAAPEATLRALLGALVVGILLIFPALAYLFKVFKWQTLERDQS